jgi:uncharacterized protein (TIGR03435 family)
MYLVTIGLVLVLAPAGLFAQNPAAAPAFEVASIKPSGPLDPGKIGTGKFHIGMSIDAARVDIGGLPLRDLICIAYRLKPYQVSGPDWMSGQRFDVVATIPEGASKDKVPEMLQALLVERFKLTIHRDTKEHSVYALVVGKNGLKMKESTPGADPPAATAATPATPGAATPAPPPPPAPPAPATPGKNTFVFNAGDNQMRVNRSSDGSGASVSGGPLGNMKMTRGEGGTMRMEFSKMNMPALADMLARFLDRPVVDMTELKGTYQVALDLSMDEMLHMASRSGVMSVGMAPAPGGAGDGGRPADAASTPSGSTIFASVQQMGLKLEPRKSPVEILVVDHLEKAPSEN